MNDLNLFQTPAARTRSSNLLAWLLPAALILALLTLFLAGGATASAQVVINGQNVLTSPICGSQKFFRLSQ